MPLSTQQIVNRFNRAASTYDEVASLQRSMGQQLVDMLGDANPNAAIADLGCGTGHLLALLNERGYLNLTGYDIAASMLDVARERNPDAGTKLALADLTDTPAADGQFDVVISNAAIQWCDTSAAVAEIHRITQPGGRILLSTFGPRTLFEWRDTFRLYGHEAVHLLDSAEQIESAMTASGLHVKTITSHEFTRTFDDVPSMFAAVRKLGAANARTDAAPLRKSVYREVMREFLDRLEIIGQLPLTFEVINVDAIRDAGQ